MTSKRMNERAIEWAEYKRTSGDSDSAMVNALLCELKNLKWRHKNLKKIIRRQGKGLRRQSRLIFQLVQENGVLERDLKENIKDSEDRFSTQAAPIPSDREYQAWNNPFEKGTSK